MVERLSQWILSIRRDGSVSVRLFCFPPAGAGASFFCAWGSSLPDGIEICAVQLPGREERMLETPCRHVADLVRLTVPELRPFLDRPFALFGHSMGGLIAYEIARALCSSGRSGIHVFLSGQPAPHLPSRRPPRHTLSSDAFKAALVRLGGTPEAILADAEMMALLEPLLRADFALAETYTCDPGEPLDVPMTIFGGVDDPEASLPELEAWQAHSRHFRGVHLFPGNHFYVRDDPAPLVRAITAQLVAVK